MNKWLLQKDELGQDLIRDLYKFKLIKTWYRDNPNGWILQSGIWSPFYIQLRPLVSNTTLLQKIGVAMARLIQEEAPDITKLAGIAMTGIPIALAISFHNFLPVIYTRKLDDINHISNFEKQISSYGEHSLFEGKINEGDVIGLIDDLVTSLQSKLIARKQILYSLSEPMAKSITCNHIFVLFDREQGAGALANQEGLSLHSLIPFASKGLEWLKSDLSHIEFDVIQQYLSNSKPYQNKEKQSELFKMANH